MSGATAWLAALLLGSAGLAHAAPAAQACGPGGCGASRIDPALIRAAVRGADRDAGPGRPAKDAAALPAPAAMDAGRAARTWERRVGGPGAREEYDCALSFGLGGSLQGDGFLATRLLGRTRVWRGE